MNSLVNNFSFFLFTTAITGGLAAPLLAPLLVGLTGATFFATAGGVALMTSLFGLTGKKEKGLENLYIEIVLTL